MVCFYHFVVYTLGYIDTQAIKEIFFFGINGVHVFFAISGIVIPMSMIRGGYEYRKWGIFMGKRLARLEPPYLVSILFALLYFQARQFSPTSVVADLMPGTRDLLLHVGYLVPFFDGRWALAIYWTLSVEFQYYLIISLLLPIALYSGKLKRYAVYMLFLLAPFFVSDNRFFPVYAPIFLLGITYTFLRAGRIKPLEYLVITILCLISSGFVLPISNSIVAISTIIIVHLIPQFKTRVLDFLGKISYSLYLVHAITGGALINFLSHRFVESYQKPIVIIAGYLVAVMCAFLFYRLIEIRSKGWSKKIKYKDIRKAVPTQGSGYV